MADPRLTPARPDVAAEALRGQVEAARFVAARPRAVATPLAPMTATPNGEAETVTHLLLGERFDVYDADGMWAWGQAEDGYVGYVPDACLAPPGPAPTHRVAALQAPVYPEPSIRARPFAGLPFAARLRGAQEGAFLRLEEGGFLCVQHVAPANSVERDWVATALRFLGAPYLWGGKSAAGIDCSGLVQLARQSAGLPCPRDSDMQAAEGEAVAPDALKRGDLVFWRGHVGIMLDRRRLLHATGHAMAVVVERLDAVCARVAAQGHGDPTALRRWPARLRTARPAR
jgi:hypothetical protein